MANDNAVDDIKQRLDIVEHISAYVQLKRAGTNYKGLCPFHGEKTPSFMVSPEKQIFHCFGCGEGGDVFGFTMKYEGLSFPEALELLANKTGVELKRVSNKDRTPRQALKAIQKDAAEFFSNNLRRVPAASKYLLDRGISEQSIERFSMGFAPPGWHNLESHLKDKGHKAELILKSGLVATGQKGSYDIFRNRIMYPIYDLHTDVIAFGGRVMDDSEPKYLNSPDTDLFHKGDNLYALHLAKEGIRRDKFAVIVEGYMDAIMCHQHGLDSAVAPLGTALTQGHLKKLRRFSDSLILIFDGDRAGVAAARRSLDLIMKESMETRILVLPEGEDPDSILNKKGIDHMRAMISSALKPVEFVLKHTEAKRSVYEAVEMIAKASDPIMRDQLIAELGALSRVSEGAIREKLGMLKRGAPQAGTQRRPVLKAYNEETLLLSAIIADPSRCPAIMESISINDIEDPLTRTLMQSISSNPVPIDNLLSLAGNEEERELITRLLVNPGFEPEHIEKNIHDCLSKIAGRSMDRQIRDAQDSGDMKLLQDLIVKRNLSRGTLQG